ncbi:MAG: hypothetical protein ABSG95_07435 [Solirubrobacteraceae bacterium]|jgi:hypothetical protein
MRIAYLMTHFWPGGTEEQYHTSLEVLHPPGGLPEWQRYHAAGPTEGGFLVAAVWDSKEHADRFIDETLMAKMPIEGGLVGLPQERVAEAVNLVTVLRPRGLKTTSSERRPCGLQSSGAHEPGLQRRAMTPPVGLRPASRRCHLLARRARIRAGREV